MLGRWGSVGCGGSGWRRGGLFLGCGLFVGGFGLTLLLLLGGRCVGLVGGVG